MLQNSDEHVITSHYSNQTSISIHQKYFSTLPKGQKLLLYQIIEQIFSVFQIFFMAKINGVLRDFFFSKKNYINKKKASLGKDNEKITSLLVHT